MESALGRFYHGFKRAERSRCNICGQRRMLTWDHVPPRRCQDRTAVELQTAFQNLVSGKKNYSYSISQNGVKYRTLCRECNNDLLGARLDPHLVRFSDEIASAITSRLTMPRFYPVPVDVPKLVRAVYGHMLAAKVTREDTVSDQLMRATVLEPAAPLPPQLRLFFWVYPYSGVVAIRDVIMPTRRGDSESLSMFSILKFFPVAFLLADCKVYEGLPHLDAQSHGPAASNINVDLKLVKPPDWPEEVERGNFVLAGQSWGSAVTARPRKQGGR